MRIKSTTLVLTLLISSYTIFSPLNAWIDHIFDFHPEPFKENCWRGQEEAEKENKVWSEIGRKDNDRSTGDSKGTNSNTPDRDK